MSAVSSLGKRTWSLGPAAPASGEARAKFRPAGKSEAGDGAAARTSLRPETPLGGTSGRAAGSKRPETAAPRLGQKAQEPGGFDEVLVLSRSRRKPRKLYDKKALSLARKAEASKAAGRTKSRASDMAKLALAFGLLAALGAGLSLALPEVTRVSKVTVRGMSVVSEGEVIQAMRLDPKVNLINADLGAMEGRILGNPKIARARILRSFPDRLVVEIAERVPVACVLVSEEIGTKCVAIDSQGVAFAVLEQAGAAAKLPVLSGIRFERFRPGQSLPASLLPLMGDLAELSKASPSPLSAFSEIKVQRISDSEVELLLYPSGSRVPVRMPARLSAASLGQALLVLDILEGREGADKVEEVDLRTGTIVYKTKEAQAG